MATDERVHVERTWNVRDSAGNGYGILDVHQDASDPAVLLGIRVASTGEYLQIALRAGLTTVAGGVELVVEELVIAPIASVTLRLATTTPG